MWWNIFCRVIDNLGDIGVCWRLCADLASRGERVRLWIDVPDDLAWMAPGALQGQFEGIELIRWTEPLLDDRVAHLEAGVWVEAFGCDPASECLDALTTQLASGAKAPVWLNLEHLSAEAYVERCHRLPSPILSGPLQGQTKWFFYPGFTEGTGGLLREANLLSRQSVFDAPTWLASLPLAFSDRPKVSLFCYEPDALAATIQQSGIESPCDWLITAGRSADAVAQRWAGAAAGGAALHRLPGLTQPDYDHLLWSCDLNFVRGEDSLVRALWAGKPFVWNIYPQHDQAHHAKLEAFLDWLQAPESMRRFHRIWNGLEAGDSVWPGWREVRGWSTCVRAARERLIEQPDLTSQLIQFAAQKR